MRATHRTTNSLSGFPLSFPACTASDQNSRFGVSQVKEPRKSHHSYLKRQTDVMCDDESKLLQRHERLVRISIEWTTYVGATSSRPGSPPSITPQSRHKQVQ